MPLHDHFRKPAETRAPWASVCSHWVVYLSKRLNATLPTDRFQSLATTHLGSAAEADVSEFEVVALPPLVGPNNGGGVAVMEAPAVVATFKTAIPEEFAVRVHDIRDDMRLVGAVEFVSPANKDRPQERARFVSKCLGYLSAGIGLVIVDIVTTRTANLHNELMAILGGPPDGLLPDVPTYVAGYRSVPSFDQHRLDLWPYPAPVGAEIPSVPLVLKDGPAVKLDLEGTYTEAAAEHGLKPPPRSS